MLRLGVQVEPDIPEKEETPLPSMLLTTVDNLLLLSILLLLAITVHDVLVIIDIVVAPRIIDIVVAVGNVLVIIDIFVSVGNLVVAPYILGTRVTGKRQFGSVSGFFIDDHFARRSISSGMLLFFLLR